MSNSLKFVGKELPGRDRHYVTERDGYLLELKAHPGEWAEVARIQMGSYRSDLMEWYRTRGCESKSRRDETDATMRIYYARWPEVNGA